MCGVTDRFCASNAPLFDKGALLGSYDTNAHQNIRLLDITATCCIYLYLNGF